VKTRDGRGFRAHSPLPPGAGGRPNQKPCYNRRTGARASAHESWRARRESVWTFTVSKTLAKFRVELIIGVGQESVERTLLAKIIHHGIVGDAALGEGACRLFRHYEHQHRNLGPFVACGGMAAGIAIFFSTFHNSAILLL